MLTYICACISQIVWDKSMVGLEGITSFTLIVPCKQCSKPDRARCPTEYLHIIAKPLLLDGNTSRSDSRFSGSTK